MREIKDAIRHNGSIMDLVLEELLEQLPWGAPPAVGDSGHGSCMAHPPFGKTTMCLLVSMFCECGKIGK